ncbi:hypothetical protein ACOMHN_065127 [Nucella lapillus]
MIVFHHIAFAVLVLAVTWHTAHAQWAQSLGWGGAGSGKRAAAALPLPYFNSFLPMLRHHPSPRDVIGSALPSMTSQNSAPYVTECPMDPAVLKMIANLVVEEEARIQECRFRK